VTDGGRVAATLTLRASPESKAAGVRAAAITATLAAALALLALVIGQAFTAGLLLIIATGSMVLMAGLYRGGYLALDEKNIIRKPPLLPAQRFDRRDLREVTRVRSTGGNDYLQFVGSDGQVRFTIADGFDDEQVHLMVKHLDVRLVDER
jgi:hypothetical protein